MGKTRRITRRWGSQLCSFATMGNTRRITRRWGSQPCSFLHLLYVLCFCQVVVFLAFGGTLISYVLRLNLNIAVVVMTDNNEVLCANVSNQNR